MVLTINDAVDFIFSHNERVSIWAPSTENGQPVRRLVWTGMAHSIPAEYLDCIHWKIFGLVPESIVDADIINIELLN